MAMGDRPGVETASAPVAALDVALGLQYVASRWVVCHSELPFEGGSSALSNLGRSVTREVVRSFMGYASSLCISEFRSFELIVDNACKVIMPPFVRSLEVVARQMELGGVPGILYLPRDRPPIGVILYLHGGGYIGTSPNMCALFHGTTVPGDGVCSLCGRLPTAPQFPYPAGAEDASDVCHGQLSSSVSTRRAGLCSRRLGRWRTCQYAPPGSPRARRPSATRRAHTVLAGGGSASRSAISHRERSEGCPAVEHSDDFISTGVRRVEPPLSRLCAQT